MIAINNFLKLFTLIMIYNLLYNKGRKKHIFISALLAGVVTFIPSSEFLATEIVDDSNLISYVIFNILVICIYSIFIKFTYKDNFFNAISNITISFLILLIPEYTVTFLVVIFKIGRSTIYVPVLLLAAFYATLLITYNVRKRLKFKEVNISLINIKIASMGMVTLGLIAIVIRIVNNEINIEAKMKIFLYIILSCFVITTLVLATDILHEMNEKRNLEMQCKYNIILEEYIEKIRATEHEYKNHLNIIYTMLDVGSDEEIREMARKYIDENNSKDKITELIYINNTILKAIIYSKICVAEENNINFKHEIKSNLKTSPLKDEELVVLLTNLLNNAIEASKDSSKRNVCLQISETTKDKVTKYNIKVRNSTKDIREIQISEIMKKGYSSKGVGRGYGLSNIKDILNKHKGTMMFTIIDDDCLEVEVEF